jgi:hypothetical protein
VVHFRFCLPLILAGLLACSPPSVTEQAKSLGNDAFSQAAWKASSQAERGKMVASFLSQHDPQTLTANDVKELLGPPTGYYDHDENPAYMVGPDSIESVYGKGYLLAFIADKSSGRITSLKIIPEPRR